MPNLLDPKQLPESGRIVKGDKHDLKNTETYLSFDQAFTNAAYPAGNKGEEFDGENLTWTTSTDVELPIRFNNLGFGSHTPMTLVEIFANSVKRFGPLPSLYHRPKGKLNKPWVMYTWQAYWNDSCKCGKSLMSIGTKEKQVISIMGFNQPAWLMAHMGAIFAGALPSGIYPSSSPDIVKYILKHSNSGAIFCDTQENADKIISIWNELPFVKKVVMYYDEMTPYYRSKGVMSFHEFLEIGSGVTDKALSERMNNQKPGECSSLIYTSGTTGPPKAVMISHDNAVWTGYLTSKYTLATPSDRMVSYLPLSHIAAQITDCYSCFHSGHQIYFANFDALQGSLLASMKEIKPTWFLGVPRVWEKIEMGLRAVSANASPMRKKLTNWVKKIGYEGTKALLEGRTPPKSYAFVDHMFLSKIRQALGLDQCKGLAVSAAPILPATQEYFMSLGMPISNIYGLSETTGPHCFSANCQNWFKVGSVGFTMNGVESHINEPDENGVGELWTRGRHVFMGYYKDKAATKKVIDKNGFFRTGDTGYYDANERLYIVGRIKELIITAGGENVPPLLIEMLIKEEIPFMTNCILVGDGRPYLSVMLCLKSEMAKDGFPTTRLTQDFVSYLASQGSKSTTTVEAANDPVLAKIIDEAIDAVNKKVASRAQQVRKWTILHKDFTENGGELTSTLKLKRSVVLKKYKDTVDSMYNSDMYQPRSKI